MMCTLLFLHSFSATSFSLLKIFTNANYFKIHDLENDRKQKCSAKNHEALETPLPIFVLFDKPLSLVQQQQEQQQHQQQYPQVRVRAKPPITKHRRAESCHRQAHLQMGQVHTAAYFQNRKDRTWLRYHRLRSRHFLRVAVSSTSH